MDLCPVRKSQKKSYTRKKCPICSEKFKADDDIVVCPKCGAPYHRSCYEKEGRCIFAVLPAPRASSSNSARPHYFVLVNSYQATSFRTIKNALRRTATRADERRT